MWPGVWLGAALTNLTIQGAPLLALLIGTGNTLEALVAGAMIRQYINKRGEFESGEAVVMFIAFCALSALIAATIGTFSLTLFGGLSRFELPSNAWTWFEGDVTGMLIITPLIMTWSLRPLPRWKTANGIEGVALAATLSFVTVLVFRNVVSTGMLPLAFITMPFVLWAAIRFEQRAVTAAIAAIAFIAIGCTLAGRGQFALFSAEISTFFLLAYTSTLMSTGLVLSAVIGQRKRAERAVRNRVEELQASERHINEFLAMLSHELRNPLAPMVNALALMHKVPASEHSPMLAIIERQVAHLSHIVDDLLDVSRITRGKILLQMQIVDLNEIVSSALQASQPEIAARGHQVQSQFPVEPLIVDADPTRIAQVALNLINNAAKYTPAGGQIAISVRRENNHAVIAVRDSGIGISPELLPKVFDLFMQGDRTLDRTEGGLGIGLTIAKRIVEMHGGSMTARSSGPGKGSEFTVLLPAIVVPARPAPMQKVARSAPASRRRLLVVDDHRESADTLAMLLTVMGHEVEKVYDGQAAIELAARTHPDAVLLDIGLPVMNGYEVARALRNAPESSRMVLIAISGYGQDEDRRRSREAGFDHHLVKPVEPAELARIIDALAVY
jgi:signal transduction histidine kinase/CheY-like chemotaxis protein